MRKKIYINLEREAGNICIKIKAPKELEDFYKKVSNSEVQQSTYWKDENGVGQKFYKLSAEYRDLIEKALGSRQSGNYIDEYGNGLVMVQSYNNKYNIAPIRTVGISSGYVCLKSERFEQISNLELEDYIRELGQAVKKIWETLINKTKIKSVITFEL